MEKTFLFICRIKFNFVSIVVVLNKKIKYESTNKYTNEWIDSFTPINKKVGIERTHC